MHIFEAECTSNPGGVIMSQAGLRSVLLAFTTSSPPTTVERASSIRADWEQHSSRTTQVSAESMRRGSDHIAQSMLAERGANAHFTYAELATFCHHVTDALSPLPRSTERYTRATEAFSAFIGELPDDWWPTDTISPVGLDTVHQAWTTAFNETSTPASGLLTGAQLLAVVDAFIAMLFSAPAATEQQAG